MAHRYVMTNYISAKSRRRQRVWLRPGLGQPGSEWVCSEWVGMGREGCLLERCGDGEGIVGAADQRAGGFQDEGGEEAGAEGELAAGVFADDREQAVEPVRVIAVGEIGAKQFQGAALARLEVALEAVAHRLD